MTAIRNSSSELMAAIRGLSAARDLPPEVIMDALKDALVSAYHKMPGTEAGNVTVDIAHLDGPKVYSHHAVVEAKHIEDPTTEMDVKTARAIEADAAVGDIITQDVTPDDFGRIAAQTAKQVILQRIREAEREQTYSTYADREGEIVYGIIQTANRDLVTVALDRVEAVLPKSGQIPGERYSPNQRLRVYVAEVKRSPKGPQVIVSRTHRDMLRRLMELEIPEIFQGVVEIKAIAREAGSRSKVAVWASQQGVDPVGACVGMRGVRIQALVRELGGEKIDIVEWEADPRVFIAHALSPAKVMHVLLVDDAERRTANVIVPDGQLSLAIGREGQNARLAAKLTGWRIDIRSESEAADVIDQLRAEDAARAAREAELAAEGMLEGIDPHGVTQADESDEDESVADDEALAAEAVAEPAEPDHDIEEDAESEDAAETDEAAFEDAEDTPAAVEEETEEESSPEVEPWSDWDSLKDDLSPAAATPAARADAPKPVIPTPAAPFDEDDDDEMRGKKRKARRLVRDPKTGKLMAKQRRKRSRERPSWEEDIGRWNEDELEDALGFTEDDFLLGDDVDDDDVELEDGNGDSEE